jgi:DnaJ-domain-containing protein 1
MMSDKEMIVVAFCGFLGYWIVSFIFGIEGGADRVSKKEKRWRFTNTKHRNKGDTSFEDERKQGKGEAHNDYKSGEAGHDEKTNTNSDSKDHQPDSEKSNKWYEVLHVAENSTIEEISVAFKRRISKYHPDKVATLGEELRELAEKKSKEINVAYETVMKIRKNK